MKEGTKVYEDLGNGVVAIDAEEYNRPFAEMAQRTYYAFLVTAIVIGLIILFSVVFPLLQGMTHSSICHFAPKWPVYGGCS